MRVCVFINYIAFTDSKATVYLGNHQSTKGQVVESRHGEVNIGSWCDLGNLGKGQIFLMCQYIYVVLLHHHIPTDYRALM